MRQNIMDEVAFLFVEQYENLRGLYSENYEKADVEKIRNAADKGENVLFDTAAAIFSDQWERVLVDAASNAMDYIVYVDETWTPIDTANKSKTLETERIHMEALKTILIMARLNQYDTAKQIERIYIKAAQHLRHLEEKRISL